MKSLMIFNRLALGRLDSRIGLVLATCVVGWCMSPGMASAQVLNQQLLNLTQNQCANLGVVFGTTPLGPNLDTICSGVLGVPSASGGGGAAALQTSNASILNRTIFQRMEEDRAESGQTGATASAMSANPFGVLTPGFFGLAGVTSPGLDQNATGSTVFNTSTGSRWNGLGFFASGLVEKMDRNIGVFEDGYKSNVYGFTVGTDYRLSRQSTVGAAFSYANTNGDFRNGGDFSTNAYTATFFGSYYPTDRSFLQLNGSITANDFKVARATNLVLDPGGGLPVNTIAGTSSSSSRGNIFRIGALGGYDYPLGRFTVGPRAGFNYARTSISDYREQGSTGLELAYDPQQVESFQSVVGLQGSASISTPIGVFIPQGNFDYIHEFENSQRAINVHFVEDLRSTPFRFTFQNDRPVRNYFYLGTGLVAILPGGVQPFVNFRAMVGNSQFTNYIGTFGVRVEL